MTNGDYREMLALTTMFKDLCYSTSRQAYIVACQPQIHERGWSKYFLMVLNII